MGWVRRAAPYIHAFGERTFVIGIGGEVLEGDAAKRLAHDCNLLAALEIRLVLVPGARPRIERELARQGLTPVYHRGLRVTDAPALECVKQAMGALRIDIEALFSQGLPNTPMAGSQVRVSSGNFITAKPVGVYDGVDYQFTGTVRRIDVEALNAALDSSDIVLVMPHGHSPSGEVFNLCMEEVAEACASALKAEKLVYLCDAPGLVDERGKLVPEVTAEQAEVCLAGARGISEDLGLYLPYAIRAVKNGVHRAHLIDRDLDGGLLLEFFTPEGVGTVVTREPLARVREAVAEDLGAIVGLIQPLEEDGTLVRRGREVLERELDKFSVLEHDGVVAGCAALYAFGEEGTAELACVAVMPDYRRRGLGALILDHMEWRARAAGLKTLFVLTTRTEHWFLERGFVLSDIKSLPRAKRDYYNLQRRSKVFRKTLS